MKEENKEPLVLIEIGPSKGAELPEPETVLINSQRAALTDCVFCVDIDEHRLREEAIETVIRRDGTMGYVSDDADVYFGAILSGDNDHFYSPDRVYSERDDIYFFDDDVANERGYYWYSSVDDYRSEDPDDDESSEMYRFSYHSGNRHSYLSGQKFGIGFEVEKEDEGALMQEKPEKLFNRTKWAKESDGSLDSDSGYELVSPVFPLFEHNFKNEFEKVRYLLDAEYSLSCGGHINLSMKGKSGEEFLSSLLGWLPLFYAMYPGRIEKNYSRAKKKENYGGDKYSAIHLKSPNIVEFRIISAVRDVENLLWRTELFKIMCSNLDLTELQVLRMVLTPKTELHKHLYKIYQGERLMNLIRNFVKFSDDFNDAKMPTLTEERIKKFEENYIKQKGGK